MGQKLCLAVLSNNSDVQKLRLDTFVHQYLDVVKRYDLLVPRGTYTRIISGGRDADGEWRPKATLGTLTAAEPILREGARGGLIQLAHRALKGRCHVLLYFVDSTEVDDLFPEHRQLIRACTLPSEDGPLLLLTVTSAELWAEHEAEGAQSTYRPASDDTLVLIAHDQKKLAMCQFVAEHARTIARFSTILATRTTGSFLQAMLPADKNRVEKFDSGPSGGDLEITERLLTLAGTKRTAHVCFFIDPNTAHPHEPDIQSLLRACTLDDMCVNLRLTKAAATSWIRTVAWPENQDE